MRAVLTERSGACVLGEELGWTVRKRGALGAGTDRRTRAFNHRPPTFGTLIRTVDGDGRSWA